MSTSEAVTKGVRVEVRSKFEPSRSDAKRSHWFFSYTIRITNEGSEGVQLISRHWIITDANGQTEEVRGPGVIGKQPSLQPGQSFEYTSFCPLPTPFGTMAGTYQMISMNGEHFDAEIAPFTLCEPYAVN